MIPSGLVRVSTRFRRLFFFFLPVHVPTRSPLGAAREGAVHVPVHDGEDMVQGPRPERTPPPRPSDRAHPPNDTRQFRVLDRAELADAGAFAAGVAFSTISVNPETYLPWLKSELVKRGVTFVRKKIASLGEAAACAGPGGVLVNASGLGNASLFAARKGRIE
jgi:hypothetical protein